MASSKAGTYITYRQPGTQPPIYVAGTFSDPPWDAQEMDYTTDEDGEHLFKKEIMGEPGSKIQYKFRIGDGDWWVLHDDVPTVKDSDGNINHELVVPQFHSHFDLSSASMRDDKADGDGDAVSPKTVKPFKSSLGPADKPQTPVKHVIDSRSDTSTPTYASVAAEVADSAALLNKEKPETPIPDEVAGKIGYRRLSSTPIVEVANTAAEVADTARDLDYAEEVVGFRIIPVNGGPEQRKDFLDDEDEIPDNNAPLFSHECIGMYDDEEVQESDSAGDTHHEPKLVEGEDNLDDIDLDDPTLERFPSNREQIIDAVRKLETGLTEDQASFEGATLSPVIGSPSRRGTDDAVSDLLLSPVPVSTVVPRAVGRLGLPRSPRTSVISAHSSQASLHAIAETDELDLTEESKASPVVLRMTPQMRSPLRTPSSDEDEGVVLKDCATPEGAKGEHFKRPTPEAPPFSGREATHSLPQHNSDALEGGKETDCPDGDSKRSVPKVPETPSPRSTQSGSPGIAIDAAEGIAATGQGVEQDVGRSNEAVGESSATGVDGDTSSTHLRKRARPDEQPDATVSHSVSARPPDHEEGWLTAFFRLLFVDWIGGFISRLCGGRRKT